MSFGPSIGVIGGFNFSSSVGLALKASYSPEEGIFHNSSYEVNCKLNYARIDAQFNIDMGKISLLFGPNIGYLYSAKLTEVNKTDIDLFTEHPEMKKISKALRGGF